MGGVYNGLLKNFTPSADRIGGLFEQLIYSQLRHSASAQDLELSLYTFRTRGGYEIDFLIQLEGSWFALECKATPSPNSDDVRTLKLAPDYLPKVKNRLLLHTGNERRKINGVWCMRWQAALKELGL